MTKTFLFTDIEGSTRLWEAHQAAMRAALAVHDRVTTTTIEAHGGSVFKHLGDGVIAVFSDASEAIEAAVDLQTTFDELTLPDVGTLPVRMGIHAGEAEERDGDYFGPTVNRAARLMAAGHGGQVLVSGAAKQLAGDNPDMVDLGQHRLRDLSEPERIYQVGSAGSFPPLRTLDASPNNLPVFATSFVGRVQEMAEVDKLLRGARLVTISGAGGAGKTRLALHVAASAGSRFPDGVWFVPLGRIEQPASVIHAVSEAVGVRQDHGSVREALLGDLIPKTALLLLDNCEHLADAVVGLIDEVMARAPDCRVIATSREVLRADGEVAYPLAPLPVPPEGATTGVVGSARRYDAVALLHERAVAARPDLLIDERTAEAMVAIARRLDGIPLAIELAASITRTYPPTALAELLAQRLRVPARRRTGLPHQQTLDATLSWSYELLGPRERTLLHRVSVFQGGFDAEAARAVAATESLDAHDVVSLLPKLVDSSWLTVEVSGPIVRYRMLGILRAFAAERLAAGDDEDRTRSAHARYFEHLAHAVAQRARDLDGEASWATVGSELDNLRTAAAWARETGHHHLALSILTPIWRFWASRGRWLEGVELIRRTLDAADQPPGLLEADALHAIGSLLTSRGGPALEARAPMEAALATYRQLYAEGRSPMEFPSLLVNYATFLAHHGASEAEVADLTDEAIRVAEALDDSRALVVAVGNRALGLARTGHPERARELFATAWQRVEALPPGIRRARLENIGGAIEFWNLDHEAAISYFCRSADTYDAAGLAVHARYERAFAAAVRLVAEPGRPATEALEAIADVAGHPELVRARKVFSEMLLCATIAEARAMAWDRVALVWGAYDALVGADFPIVYPAYFLEAIERSRRLARQTLGGAETDDLMDVGRSLDPTEVLDLLAGNPRSRGPRREGTDG